MREPSAFLAAVQPLPTTDERIEMRTIAPRGELGRVWVTSHDALADRGAALAVRTNVYFGVALRRSRGGGRAEDCTRIAALWADPDAKLWPDAADPLAAALRAIERFPLVPSALVCSSGGYHGYWCLDAPVDLHSGGMRARVESVNAALARAVCGPERMPDHVQDVARILRLPGTFNYKYAPVRPVTLEQLDPSVRYTLDDIDRELRQHYTWAIKPALATRAVTREVWAIPAASPRDLRERAAQGRIRPETLALLDSVGPAGYKSPSEADAAIAAGLVSAGLTASEVLAVLLDSTRGKDALQRKGEKYGEAYLQRTIGHAAGFVGPVILSRNGRRGRRLPSPMRPVEVPLPSSSRPSGVPLRWEGHA